MDHSRYSRQVYSIGEDVMYKLSNSSILIIGYNCLSLEIIKNLSLSGINIIDICKTNNLDNYQKTNLYYNYDNNIIPINEFRKLNPTININEINVLDEEQHYNHKLLKKYNLIICSNNLLNNNLLLNTICNQLKIPFIMTGTYGLMGYIFNDWGDNFKIFDEDGEIYENLIINEIENEKIIFKDYHKLSDNDTLIIKYKNNEEIEIIVEETISPTSIKCKNIIIVKDFIKSIFKKKKESSINFASLKNNLSISDNITIFDYSFPSKRYEYLHNLHLALNKYIEKFEELPRSWSIVDYEIFKKFLKKNDLLDKDFLLLSKIFCFTVKGDLLPINSIFGAITCHEVLKCLGHKFIPIRQWLYMDYFDLFVEEEINTFNDITRKNFINKIKYEGITNILGNKLFNKIQYTIPFVIGAGAIGCELLKNLGMLGIKNIKITDMDHIEKSNLSRQFLFHDENIGKLKDEIASKKIMGMNNETQINYYSKKICKETENIFDTNFHNNINIYLNALDNIEGRMYMDQLSIKYQKPLIDSGTLGSKGNVQVVIPYLSETYGSSKDPEDEQKIPLCTLKTFPYKPEHTIQWARELFENEFIIIPLKISKYKNINEYNNISDSEKRLFLKDILKYENFNRDNFNTYILKCLYNIFIINFEKNIDELYEKYSNDIFKKLPDKLNKNLLCNFLKFGCEIYNQIFGLQTDLDYNKFDNELINSNYYIDIEFIENISIEECIERTENILKNFPNINLIEFDKDNSDLYHIEWINECANLRNIQYKIEETSLNQTRLIAGKIIPAMISTTSLIAGFQIMEFIKLVKFYDLNKYKNLQNNNDINIFKNRFVNLNINYCDGINPAFPKNYLLKNGNKLNLWTNFNISTNLTNLIIEEIYFKTNKKVDFIIYGNDTVYDGDTIIINEINSNQNEIIVLLEDIPFGIYLYN